MLMHRLIAFMYIAIGGMQLLVLISDHKPLSHQKLT